MAKPGPKSGYKQTEEHRRNNAIGHLGIKWSEEAKKRHGEKRKGIVFSALHRANMSKAQKGKPRANKEKRTALLRSEKVIEKRKANLPKGENHHWWKGGISKNREYRNWYVTQRKLKVKAAGSHTFGEWETLIVQYNCTCPCCKRKEPDIKLTMDHIIPISRGGSNNIENIQPLCMDCNMRKYTKTIKY